MWYEGVGTGGGRGLFRCTLVQWNRPVHVWMMCLCAEVGVVPCLVYVCRHVCGVQCMPIISCVYLITTRLPFKL